MFPFIQILTIWWNNQKSNHNTVVFEVESPGHDMGWQILYVKSFIMKIQMNEI